MMRKHHHSDLPTTLSFTVPMTWSPQQALAIIELLENLRDQIWQDNEAALIDIICAEQRIAPPDPLDHDCPDDDPPF
jgi:hypothetical protein